MKLSVQSRLMVLGLLFVTAHAHAGPSFDFSFFRFRTFTQDHSGSSIMSDVASIDTPQNPIGVLQDTGFGNNHSRTQIDVAWSGYSGVFNSAIDQHIEDISFLTSYRIELDFYADIDLILDVDMNIDYVTPAGQLVLVSADYLVDNQNTSEVLIDGRFDGGGSALEPPVGNFNLQEQILLPSGSDYEITLSVRGVSATSLPPMTTPIDITGFVNFSIQPVPEPVSVVFVGVIAMGLVGHRPRRR